MEIHKYTNVELCIYVNKQKCIYVIVLLCNHVLVHLRIEQLCEFIHLCICLLMY